MAPRVMSPKSYRMLEWGMLSSMPGSRVLDARSAFVFTGSLVRDLADETLLGHVDELIDVDVVRVLWGGEPEPSAVILHPNQLLVLVALPESAG